LPAAVFGVLASTAAVTLVASSPPFPDATADASPPRSGLRVDLRGAIERALANNPDLKAADHDLEAAHARRDAAFAEMLPAVRNLTFLTESRRDQRKMIERILSIRAALGPENRARYDEWIVPHIQAGEAMRCDCECPR